MSPLQKHIADSLERFDQGDMLALFQDQKLVDETKYGIRAKIINDQINKVAIGRHYQVRKLLEHSLLQLLSIARGEVEKILEYDGYYSGDKDGDYTVWDSLVNRQNVLDTLTITNLTKE